MDEKGQGYLDAVHTMIALRTANPHLSDADEDFVYTVSAFVCNIYYLFKLKNYLQLFRLDGSELLKRDLECRGLAYCVPRVGISCVP